jgi:outer membrane protein TolC
VDNRPDLQLLAADVEAAEAEAGIARKGSLPELEVQARRSPWNDRDVFFGGRIQLTWSLYDHGKSRFETQAAKRKADAARASYQDAKLRALTELDANAIEIAAAESQVKALTGLLEAARDLVEKSQKGFSGGVSTLIDILEATRALREVEQELAEARLSLNLGVASRFRISGTLIEVSK